MTITPQGGKVSTGQISESHAAEIARFQKFKSEALALSVINSEPAAREYRAVLVRYNPALKKSFRELGLDF